jgi:hypothetical protein
MIVQVSGRRVADLQLYFGAVRVPKCGQAADKNAIHLKAAAGF